MSRVGETYRPEVGSERPAAGFLGGGGLLSGLRRIFGGEAPSEAPIPARVPASRTLEAPVSEARMLHGPAEEPGSFSDEAERLAAHIAAGSREGRARRILITQAPSGDAPLAALDCAAFASRLARALSNEGRTILVVFGAGGGFRPGLFELIEGSASFSEAIHREAGSRLHILPSGRGRASAGAGLNVVLDALADTYDYVVLSATDEDGGALRRLVLQLAPRAEHALIGCSCQTGSPDMVALRDAMKDEGAGEVIVTRIGLAPAESREAA